jgi:hypothetical protein
VIGILTAYIAVRKPMQFALDERKELIKGGAIPLPPIH